MSTELNLVDLRTLGLAALLAAAGCERTAPSSSTPLHERASAQSPYESYLPSTPPLEANRMNHPAGFSIASPPGWTARTNSVADFLKDFTLDEFVLQGTQDDDYRPRITVQRLGPSGAKQYEDALAAGGAVLNEFVQTQFHDQPAFARFLSGYGKSQAVRGTHQPWLLQELAFKSNGEWFMLAFNMRNADSGGPYYTQPLAIIRDYFESFRYAPPNKARN